MISRRLFSSKVLLSSASALGVAVAGVALLQSRFSSRVATLLWAALELVAFIGFGRLVQLFDPRRARPSWALCAAWGMSLFLFAGGVLVALGIATRTVLASLLVTGAAAYAFELCSRAVFELPHLRAWSRFGRIHWPLLTALAIVFGLGALHFTGAMEVTERWHVSDDAPAYFVFPKELLQTGASDQPFSMRRLVSLGGQSLLQAGLLAVAPPSDIHVFDRGTCLVMALGLVLMGARRLQNKALILFPLALILTVPDVRINSGSTMSGCVLFLGLLRTIQRYENDPRPRAQHLSVLLVGALVAGACTLRQTYVIPAGMLLLLIHVLPMRRLSWPERLRSVRLFAFTSLAVLIYLTPWLFCSYRTFSTPIFPVMNGTYRLGQKLELAYFGVRRLRQLWGSMNLDAPVKTAVLFFFLGLLMRDGTAKRATRALFFASCIGYFAVVWRAYLDVWAYARYCYAFEIASIVALIEMAFGAPPNAPGPRSLVSHFGLVAALGVALHVYALRTETTRTYDELLANSFPLKRPRIPDPADALYAAAQATVPAAEKIFAMVDEPYRFDFAKNHIYIADFPGFVSPDADISMASSAELVRYLTAHGIRYLAFVPPSNSRNLYSAPAWRHNSTIDDSDHQLMSPYFLNMFNSVQELWHSQKLLYESSAVVVVDLTRAKGG